jgi:hypothetical protein
LVAFASQTQSFVALLAANNSRFNFDFMSGNTTLAPIGRQRSNTMSSGTPTTTPSKVKKTVEPPATPNSFELLKRMASKSTPVVPATTSIAAAAVAAANAAAGQNDSPSKKARARTRR